MHGIVAGTAGMGLQIPEFEVGSGSPRFLL